jgi:hypothetical protein
MQSGITMRKHGFTLTKLHHSRVGYLIEDTNLAVERYEGRKYGQMPDWDVIERDLPDRPLVTGKSLEDALWRLARIRDLLPRAKDCPVKGAACGMYAGVMPTPEDDDDER